MEAHHASGPPLTRRANSLQRLHVRQGLAIYDPDKHGEQAFSYGGHDTAVCGKAIGGTTLWALGYPDQAICSTDRCHYSCRSSGPCRAWRTHCCLLLSAISLAVMRLQFSTSANVSSP